MDANIAFERVDPSHPDAERLMAALDAEVRALYAAEGRLDSGELASDERGLLSPHSVRGLFLLARRLNPLPRIGGRAGERAVACGGVLACATTDGGPDAAEVRRIYVAPEERGSGAARALMARLEREAARMGFARLVLHSGDRQTRAVRFYEALGYTRIPPYDAHSDSHWVVIYEKPLPPDPLH